ncbi:MAG: hypothetical protein ABGZ53_16265 [Fuerstiella sp.]
MNKINDSFGDDESSEFEQQLEALRPVACEQLTAETFYQSGWNAATRQHQLHAGTVVAQSKNEAATATVNRTAERRTFRFTLGTLCGLAFGVVVPALWHSAELNNETTDPVRSSVAVNDVSDGLASESVVAVSDVDTALATGGGAESVSQDIASVLLPWNWQLQPQPEMPIPAAARALSPVARRYWSRVILSDSSGGRTAVDWRDIADAESIFSQRDPAG